MVGFAVGCGGAGRVSCDFIFIFFGKVRVGEYVRFAFGSDEAS